MTSITSSGAFSPGRSGGAILDRSHIFEAISSLFKDCGFDVGLLHSRGRDGVRQVDDLLKMVFRALSEVQLEEAMLRLNNLEVLLKELHLYFLAESVKQILAVVESDDYVSAIKMIEVIERKNHLYVCLLDSQLETFSRMESSKCVVGV